MYRNGLKRIFDILGSMIALIVISPLLLLTSILVLFFLGRPIIYSQERPGRGGKPFLVYKFRSMKNDVDSKGHLLPDKMRITKFGRFLRSTSIDELPELFNILFGHMSLIGPRPLLMEYLPLYTMEQMRRHEVRPGLTGLAQVNGRNAISWEDRLRYDVEYVDNLTFWLDVKIMFKSIRVVLSRKGIEYQGKISEEKFKGTKNGK